MIHKKDVKRVNPEFSSYGEKCFFSFISEMMSFGRTYCGYHFTYMQIKQIKIKFNFPRNLGFLLWPLVGVQLCLNWTECLLWKPEPLPLRILLKGSRCLWSGNCHITSWSGLLDMNTTVNLLSVISSRDKLQRNARM